MCIFTKTKTNTMTTTQLTNDINKTRKRISKGNFKSGQESELHLRVDTLCRLRNGLEKLETELESLNNR